MNTEQKQILNELAGDDIANLYCNNIPVTFEITNDKAVDDDDIVAHISELRGLGRRFFLTGKSLKNCRFHDGYIMDDENGKSLTLVPMFREFEYCDELDYFTEEDFERMMGRAELCLADAETVPF